MHLTHATMFILDEDLFPGSLRYIYPCSNRDRPTNRIRLGCAMLGKRVKSIIGFAG